VEPIKVVELKRDTPVLYDKDIEPIFVKKCLVCHSDQVKEGKLDLDSHETLVSGKNRRGKLIIAGKGAESLLYKSVGRMAGAPPMPPPKDKNQPPLTPEELALVKLWIDQGAKAPATKRTRPMAVVTLPPPGIKAVRGVDISPDKGAVAGGRSNQIYIWDAKTGNHVRTLVDKDLVTAEKKPVEAAHMSIVESLAYSPDGKLIASGSFQEVKIWEAESGALKQKLTGFADRVVALAFSADGKLLATGGGPATEDGEVKIFDMTAGAKQIMEIKATDPKNNHSDTVFGVSFSPDGKLLASCGADKFIKVFAVVPIPADPAKKTEEIAAGKFIKSFEGHTHHVLGVGWSPDGKLLASCGADNVIKIWDYEKGEQVRPINNAHAKQITRLVFIGKTPTFLTCSEDQTVKKWNITNGNSAPPANFPGATDVLYAVAASPDGQLVASGGEDGVVRLYNGTNGQLFKALVPPGQEPPDKKK
jgi:WD40 repeat protein